MFPGFGSYKGGLNELIALDIEAAAIGGILDASHVSFTSMDKHIQVLPCNSQDLRRKQQYTTPNPEVEDSQAFCCAAAIRKLQDGSSNIIRLENQRPERQCNRVQDFPRISEKLLLANTRIIEHDLATKLSQTTNR